MKHRPKNRIEEIQQRLEAMDTSLKPYCHIQATRELYDEMMLAAGEESPFFCGMLVTINTKLTDDEWRVVDVRQMKSIVTEQIPDCLKSF